MKSEPNESAEKPAEDQRRFGRYTLLHRFASGGMADIYLARLVGSDGFHKLVAIKLVRRDLTSNPEFMKMLVDEARLVSRISHPNVVNVYELGRVEGTHFIAMEYVEGESVGALLRRVKPPLSYVARIAADAAAGLHAAHELRARDGELYNVIHRDVSPGNILISYQGAVKVSDFGIARARGRLQETTAGTFKGKFSYAAPELILEKPVDRRADIFSLGIVLYEMSVRRRLFKAQSPADTVRKLLSEPVAPPSKLISGFPEPLEEIVMRCLRRDPALRYQTAQELQMALERYIHATGELVVPSNVGQLMSTVFADRIKQKRELLEECTQGHEITMHEVELVTAHSARISTLGSLLGTRRRKMFVGAAALGLAAVVVLLGLLLTSSDNGPAAQTSRDAGQPARAAAPPPRPDTRPPPDTAIAARKVRWISIAVSVRPRRARITFNGRSVSNPFRLRRPAGTGEAEVVATARGYVQETVQVPLDRGGSWRIRLKRIRRGSGGRRPPRTKKKKPGLGEDTVLDNPY